MRSSAIIPCVCNGIAVGMLRVIGKGASTVQAVFGTNIHPDLAKLHCEQGALYSYREAERNLGKLNDQPRSVNNHTQVKRMTDQVGRLLAEQNGLPPAAQDCAPPARDWIMQVDGGHIPIQEKDQRSFEALAAIVYRPGHIRTIDKHHREISEKTCVMSAKDDHLHSITTYLLHAAIKQGLCSATQVTALADGATNCWAVLLAMQPYCATLDCILDWFHIPTVSLDIISLVENSYGYYRGHIEQHAAQ